MQMFVQRYVMSSYMQAKQLLLYIDKLTMIFVQQNCSMVASLSGLYVE